MDAEGRGEESLFLPSVIVQIELVATIPPLRTLKARCSSRDDRAGDVGGGARHWRVEEEKASGGSSEPVHHKRREGWGTFRGLDKPSRSVD
jgi:hypothetical protein